MGALALRSADLRDFDGEARVQDLRLGEVLGFERPRDLRKVIRRNTVELTRYGGVSRHRGAKPEKGSVGGRPEECFYLNEPQALLICMFSETDRAADVREQLIRLFMAYRQGKLAPVEQAGPRHDPLADLAARMELLERAVAANPVRDNPHFARMLAHMPDPKARRRYPAFWSDLPIRQALIAAHRQMTVSQAVTMLMSDHGRSPSKSAIHRFWMWLDEVSGKRFGGVH